MDPNLPKFTNQVQIWQEGMGEVWNNLEFGHFLHRSDCVFTIHVEQKSNGGSTVKGIRSKITLIDMAGIRNNNVLELVNNWRVI